MISTHIWPDTASIDANGHLSLGGVDTVVLAREFGTPLYVIDETTLRETMRSYKQAFARAYPHQSTVHYASKALLNIALAQIVRQEGLGLDLVSGGELFVAQRANFPLTHVHLHGNAKTFAELERALDWGVGAIVVDTLDELALLAHMVDGRARPQGILLRLAPGIDAHTHAHIATGGVDSKFGLPLEALDVAAERVKNAPGLRLIGLHSHIGSQIFDWEALQQNVEVLLDCAAQLRDRHGIQIEEISPGGGLGVPYVDGDRATDIRSYAAALSHAMVEGLTRHRLPPLRLTVEPGRSIVARAGVALYRVVATKYPGVSTDGLRPYLHIDGGMADNIRPSLYGARYTALLANRADAALGARVHVAGRFCESGDVLLRDVDLPIAGPGDLIAVAVAGAYTISMASNYNFVPRPAVVLVGEGHARVIQRRENEEDLVARDVFFA